MKRISIAVLALASIAAPSRHASSQVDPNIFLLPPSPRPYRPSDLPQLLQMLVFEARNFVPTARREVGGTRQGRQLVIRGNALESAVNALDRTIRSGGLDPSYRAARIDDFVRSLDAVTAELGNAPGAAPESAAISQRMGRLGYEINRAVGPAPPFYPPAVLPPVFPPQGPSYDRGRVMQMAQAVAVGLANANGLIQSDIGLVYPYDGAVRDLDAMGAGMQQINQLALAGAPLRRLQATYDPIRDRERRVDAALANPPSPRVRRAWRSASDDLGQLADALGLSPDFVVDPGRPVIIDPPAYPHLPWPVSPPGNRPGNAAAIALADRFAGEIDGFLAAMQPNVLKVPEGPQIFKEGKAVRNEVIAFRQTAAAGARPRELAPSLRQLEGLYAGFSSRVLRVSGGKPGPNVDRVRRMGAILDQIRGSVGR